MGRLSSGFKKGARRTRMGRTRRRNSLMATTAGPWVVLLLAVVLIAGAVLFTALFAVPRILDATGLRPTPEATNIFVPTPSPQPGENLSLSNLSAQQNEIVITERYVADPSFYGDTVYFSAGTDAGGPRMKAIYAYDSIDGKDKSEELVAGIELQNDDLFQPQRNDTYFVWVDSKRSGGGYIMARVRNGAPFVVREYYAGLPKVTLQGQYLFWMDRTGTRMDKLFVYDLATRENATIAMFENSPYGMSDVGVSAGEIVWADKGQSVGDEERSLIYSLKLDSKGGQPEIYDPGMYVHDPVTNGTVIAWSDSNHAEGNRLYVCTSRENNEAPALVESDVLHYAIGSEFLVYSKGQKIYAYFWGIGKTMALTLSDEDAQLIGVSEDKVLWYQLGQERDILKFIHIEV